MTVQLLGLASMVSILGAFGSARRSKALTARAARMRRIRGSRTARAWSHTGTTPDEIDDRARVWWWTFAGFSGLAAICMFLLAVTS